MDNYNELTTAGFHVVGEDQTPRRLLVNTQGLQRTGKTDWALRMPKPLVYVGLDFGHEGVIGKHAASGDVLAFYLNVPPISTQDQYMRYWLQVDKAIKAGMKHPKVRSVVLDTGTDVWELLRLAEFGALTKSGDVKKLYGPLNQAYRSLIRMAYDTEINLVVTHRVKKLYTTRTISTNKGPVEQEFWDGKQYERSGFGEGGYLVQVEIEHLHDQSRKGELKDKFGLRVLDCRQNMDIVGTELWGDDNNFATLAQYVFPDSDEKDWV